MEMGGSSTIASSDLGTKGIVTHTFAYRKTPTSTPYAPSESDWVQEEV